MIRVNELCKTIHGTTVLENITLDALPGRVTGLAGPNGSGKTMLMRAIAGLIQPTSGSVEVGGVDPWAVSLGKEKRVRPSIGMLLEGPAFLDGYTGLQNLSLLASLNGVATTERIEEAIRAMGLDPHDKRKYRKYSLGMKQRLGVAGAVMEDPAVLILDEPTNALDRSGVELAIQQVRKARERGATVVLTCHDTAILHELADEIWHLAEGHMDGHEVLTPRDGGGEQAGEADAASDAVAGAAAIEGA